MARSAVALLTPATTATLFQVSLVSGGVTVPSRRWRIAISSLRRLCEDTVTTELRGVRVLGATRGRRLRSSAPPTGLGGEDAVSCRSGRHRGTNESDPQCL